MAIMPKLLSLGVILAIALLAFAYLVFSESDQNLPKPIKIDTAYGPIVGETVRLDNAQTVHKFLGIPYADPPVGEHRFGRTRPLSRKWTEPYQATKWTPLCMQDVNHPFNSNDYGLLFTHKTSEDCLHLNIWTPAIPSNRFLPSEKKKLRPVIVWIHGGAFFMGTAAMALYDSKTLSNMADAVVVTINYRLAIFGFLYSDKVGSVKGNQGLWDQAMALQWIQDNIHSFGGDKNKVTIVGESAGGWSVSALILSPVSRNLFQNAYMMSGAVDHRVIGKPEQVVPMYLKGIRGVGCADESQTSITKEVIDCLNKLEPLKIQEVFHLMADPREITFSPLLTVDGEFFTDTPMEMIRKGDFKTNINLIASSVENEGSAMLAAFPQFARVNPPPMSLEHAKAFVAEVFNNYIFVNKPHLKIDTDNLNKLYFNGLNPLDDDDVFRNQASIAYGDWLLNCPVGQFAQAVKQYGGDKASVFQLFYRVNLGLPKFICSKWSLACHTDDIYSVFAIPFQNRTQHIDREREISSEVISFLSDFIRTGKPNKRMPEWQEHFLLDGKVATPYYEMTNHVRTHENFKFSLKQTECGLLLKHM